MKKTLTVISMILLTSLALSAHTPMIYVEDNYDGTIIAEAGFSNGASAADMKVIIVEDKKYRGSEKSFNNKRVLFEGQFDEMGVAELIKPSATRYLVIFDGGPGHIASIKGPTLEDDEKEDWLAAIEASAAELGVWKDYLLGKK